MRRLRGAGGGLAAAVAVLALAAPVRAQGPGTGVVRDILVEQEGRVVDDPLILGLIETSVGAPLSMADVRESITHLMNVRRFEDVQVYQEETAGGIRLRYRLMPVHAVDRLEFRGALGLDEGDLRQAVTERYGAAPPAGRAEEVAATLVDLYRESGFAGATVMTAIEVSHDPDRASMVLTVAPGPRAAIGRIDVDATDAEDRASVLSRTGLRVGEPYDAVSIRDALAEYEAQLRGRGFYEARAIHSVDFAGDGRAAVTVAVDRGPQVVVAFSGDPLPQGERDRLVPIRSEGSADEDLLEDANRNIETYLYDQGYRDAQVDYVRREEPGLVTITFEVSRGPRYLVDGVTAAGNRALTDGDLFALVPLVAGEPFVESLLVTGAAAVQGAYRDRGYTQVRLSPRVTLVADGVEVDAPGARDAASGRTAPMADRRVRVELEVAEGPRTVVGAIALVGNMALGEGRLRSVMTVAPGQAFSERALVDDRDLIERAYLDEGFPEVVVTPSVQLEEGDTVALVTMTVDEGPQVLVDRVIIVGNARVSTSTIAQAVTFRAGEPLGLADTLETQQRLSALGLFRRVRIAELPVGTGQRRDVLIEVEEAPPTTVGYGVGLEGVTRLRPTGDSGLAEERFEFAPRGFFEVGRRNLWGKNRSVNLFTRVSLRSRDIVFSDTGLRLVEPSPEGGYGFNEYRVFGTFREPRAFGTGGDFLLTGILDQAIRSSFNFATREVRAEMGAQASSRFSLAGRYSYKHTRLFDERFTEEEKPLIDRLFPEVRLSKLSMSVIRDSRDDALDPSRGTFLAVDGELAARALGSEVGFAKSFLQAFTFHRLPTTRRMVVALAARVGAAHGFERRVPRIGADGLPVTDGSGAPVVDIVQDLPASERFFAGGDTTVRGFPLDRLGDEETISAAGFPTGGNGLLVLNAELRVAVTSTLGVTGFVDAGNVFPRAARIDLGNLRGAAGFGLFFRSPIGPIRIDLGFKLDRRELVPGRLERPRELHISFGQAF